MPKSLPSPELLRKLLRYEPDTGKLFWRERTPDMFEGNKVRAELGCARWNGKNAGKQAFTANGSRGYKVGAVFGTMYLAHRVIWAIFYGHWPKDQIDHINGDRTDNRIENLRDVSLAENRKNMKIPSHNSSGIIGVHWHRAASKWTAQIKVDGCTKHLGLFEGINEAIAARKAAEVKYGFHENHGRD